METKGYLIMKRMPVNQIIGQESKEACDDETGKALKNGSVGFRGLGERWLTR
jgi:hypothetical protein